MIASKEPRKLVQSAKIDGPVFIVDKVDFTSTPTTPHRVERPPTIRSSPWDNPESSIFYVHDFCLIGVLLRDS